jgi:hypothetical protein
MVFEVDVQPYYTHEPLPNSRTHTRLLTLLPGAGTESIRARTSVHAIDNVPKYVAQSYMCGGKYPQHEIEVDGQRFLIRPNLHLFLQTIRTDKTQLIWTDAICIEQKNAEERTHQVEMMGKIYGSAESSLVWLGPAADDSDLVIDLMNDFGVGNRLPKDRRNAFVLALYHRKLMQALFSLCKRPYWQRAWIMQVRRPLCCSKSPKPDFE